MATNVTTGDFKRKGGLDGGGKPPYSGDDGGCDMNGCADRFARIESKLSNIEARLDGTDKRIDLIEQDLRGLSSKVDRHFIFLLSAIAGSFIFQLGFFGVLLGVMAKGFGWLK